MLIIVNIVIDRPSCSSGLVVEVDDIDDEVLPDAAKSRDLTDTPPLSTDVYEGVAITDEDVANGPMVVMASIESTSRSSSISEYSRTSRDSLIRRGQPDTGPASSFTVSTSVDSMTSLINDN